MKKSQIWIRSFEQLLIYSRFKGCFQVRESLRGNGVGRYNHYIAHRGSCLENYAGAALFHARHLECAKLLRCGLAGFVVGGHLDESQRLVFE